MQPHYSQSSREKATPSSGTSTLAAYKEVPPPRLLPIQKKKKIERLFKDLNLLAILKPPRLTFGSLFLKNS